MLDPDNILIQSSIPVPPIRGRGKPPKYPLGKLEIGDSFFYPTEPSRIASVLYEYGKKHKKKFTYRKENTGIRVWRVK